MLYTLLISFLLTLPQKNPLLIGKWKMQSYDAISKIKLSPGYIFGDDEDRKQMDAQFKLAIDSTLYDFKKDTLIYTSIERNTIIYRTALWELKKDTIYIDELERNYKRKALLISVSMDNLVISPITPTQSTPSKMRFKRILN